MPAVSEEELQKLLEDNEKLREQIASAGTKAAENGAAREREYKALQLVAENTRLEAELQAAKARATVANSKDGAASVLDAAKANLETAQAQGEALAGVPVDTNAENQPKNTTGATVAVKDGVVTTSPDGVTVVVAPDKSSSTSSSSSTTSTNGGNS